MNECFTELTGVIQRHGGTVEKFIGDAVMAFWNAPVPQADHAARACRAARDLLGAVARLRAGWEARGLPPVSMRVGLATGPAVLRGQVRHERPEVVEPRKEIRGAGFESALFPRDDTEAFR
jgi:adenylate cyclase